MAGLDFNFDPFKGKDPFAIKGLDDDGGAGRPQRALHRQPLAPEEYKSFAKQALDTGASGLSHVLGVLDKPGQAARGLLAGKGIGSLKHLVPFSGTTGLTSGKDYTTGRDLTDQYGMTDKRDKGWGAWGIGLGADLLTDPLSYTTFGAKHALTGTGRAVEKAGLLKGFTGQQMIKGFDGVESALKAGGSTASDIMHLGDKGQKIAGQAAEDAVKNAGLGALKADQPLSSLARFALPFDGPGINVGTGKFSQKIAGAMDDFGDKVKYGNAAGRAVGALFDSKRHGATDAITQRGAVKYMDPALQTLQAKARDDQFKLLTHLDPLISGGKHGAESTVTNAARAVAEGAPNGFDPTLVAEVGGAATHLNQVNAGHLSGRRAAGAPIKDLDDAYVNYVHRSAYPEAPGNLQIGGKSGRQPSILGTTSGVNIGRDPLFRDVPGGTERINEWFGRMAGDPNVAGHVNQVKQDLVDDLIAKGIPMTPAINTAFDAKAAGMAERLAKSDVKYRDVAATGTTPAKKGQSFFSPDLHSDLKQGGAAYAKSVSSAQTATGILGDIARPFMAGGDMVSLPDVMKKLGLETTPASKTAGTAMEGALPNVFRSLAKQGAGKVDPFLMGGRGKLRAEVAKFGITGEQFKQLTKQYGDWTQPEQLKAPGGVLDSFTNAFKALAYPIWLPAHVRNAATAATNNMREGTGLRDYWTQLRLMTGRGKGDLSKSFPSLAGMPPAQQIEELRRMQFGSTNIFGGHGMNEEVVGGVRQAVEEGKRFTPHVPGSDRSGRFNNVFADSADLLLNEGLLSSLSGTAKAAYGSVKGMAPGSGRTWGQSVGENLGIKGVAGANKDTLGAVAAGRKAGTNIEDFFRGAQWNKHVRSGMTPEMAGQRVNKLHFDYDALTDFEKNVMRKGVPFYTYMKKNLPLQLDTAIHQPGILQAQHKPFNQKREGEDGYTPKYLDSGVAIPLGEEKDGQRQFISQLGLPAEEAFERLHFKDGLPDINRTALSYMGGMNPLMKGALEQLFDTQFHTQRKLSDLKAGRAAGAIGSVFGDDNPQGLGQVMSNSPFTRFFSTADKLMDPRKTWGQKALNLATGVKVTDVDVEKQRGIDLKAAVDERMKGNPNFSQYTRSYIKPEDLANLTPEEVRLMRAYTMQQDAARAYAEQQKERIGVR